MRHTAVINGSTIGDISVDYEYIKKIRASYYLLGALLGKYKKAEVPLPGGCNIGSRRSDPFMYFVQLPRAFQETTHLILPKKIVRHFYCIQVFAFAVLPLFLW